MSDAYRTVAEEERATIKVEGSRFLAEAVPVSNRSDVKARLDGVRERERKASHHCFAYRLGTEGTDFRYDDDGEPSGTAGQPILRQIDARDLTNTLVVVTRYFGGTELGTGGLMRAYGDAADAALAQASLIERLVRTPVRVRFSYDDTSSARQVLERFDASVVASDYTDVTELTIGVPASKVDAFVQAFTNGLADRGEVLWIGDSSQETS